MDNNFSDMEKAGSTDIMDGSNNFEWGTPDGQVKMEKYMGSAEGCSYSIETPVTARECLDNMLEAVIKKLHDEASDAPDTRNNYYDAPDTKRNNYCNAMELFNSYKNVLETGKDFNGKKDILTEIYKKFMHSINNPVNAMGVKMGMLNNTISIQQLSELCSLIVETADRHIE